jgi:quinol-cytochrome oxidoreductase complex cytochrome b subunit
MKNIIKGILLQNRIWKSVLRKEIPVDDWLKTKTFGLGLINFYLFAILTLTGILLMFYYVPQTERAYQDIKDLQYAISFGAIIRNMHRWSAYLMIISVFLHMCRAFYMGEYREPREFNWVTGVLLLLCALTFGLTGYLLPWDQTSYWGLTIMSNVAASVPLIGEKLKYVVLGGTEVSQNALIRAYAMHAKVLPLVLSLIISIHFWRIRKDDLLAGSEVPNEPIVDPKFEDPGANKAKEQMRAAWPDIIQRELSKFLLILAIVMAMSILIDAPLEEQANPAVTPNPTKAAWFLLGLQEILSWGAPFWGAVVVPNLVIVFLIMIPYVDRGPAVSGVWFHPSRRLQNILFTAFVTVAIGLIIIGKFMRGPNWIFYWPWEPWPLH